VRAEARAPASRRRRASWERRRRRGGWRLGLEDRLLWESATNIMFIASLST
jgi:hypothetical protein